MKVITITANPLSSSTPSARKAETVVTEIDTSKSTEIQDILKACENRENLSDDSIVCSASYLKANSFNIMAGGIIVMLCVIFFAIRKRNAQLRFPGISEILPTLYLCGAGVAIPSIMEKLDIKCVVNVAPELPDTPLPNNRPVYLRVNVYDRRDADLKTYFDEVADLIEEVRQTNGKSLVHCVAGVSRSASLCIAYLIKHMKMSLRDAYLHVKNARPQIRPNLGFFQQLLEYEEELRGEKSVKMIFVKSLDREIPDVFEPEYRAMEEFYQKCRRHYETIRR